jgi:hypothetical protein
MKETRYIMMQAETRNLLKSGIEAHPYLIWFVKPLPDPPPGYPLCEFSPWMLFIFLLIIDILNFIK